jgi:hypothetical protein
LYMYVSFGSTDKAVDTCCDRQNKAIMRAVVNWRLLVEGGASVMFRELGYFCTTPLLAAKRAAHKAANAITAL